MNWNLYILRKPCYICKSYLTLKHITHCCYKHLWSWQIGKKLQIFSFSKKKQNLTFHQICIDYELPIVELYTKVHNLFRCLKVLWIHQQWLGQSIEAIKSWNNAKHGDSLKKALFSSLKALSIKQLFCPQYCTVGIIMNFGLKIDISNLL